MGLFDHLFKPKPEAAGEKGGESAAGQPEDAAKPGESAAPTIDPSTFLHPKGYGAGAAADPVAPVEPAGARPTERKPGIAPSQDEPTREVVLTLNDILPRIPTHYLSTGMHDLKREIRFDIRALSSDIARGRASVPLSTIAALCAEIFHSPIGPLEDIDIRLPLQKVVDQIGRIRADSLSHGQNPETPGAEVREIADPGGLQSQETAVEDAAIPVAETEAGGAGAVALESQTATTPEPRTFSVPSEIPPAPILQPRIEAESSEPERMAPVVCEAQSSTEVVPAFAEPFSAAMEPKIVEPPTPANTAPPREAESIPPAEIAPASASTPPDVVPTISAVPTGAPLPGPAAAPAPPPETAPVGGLVPPVHLPPVRPFAPPPPVFAAAAPTAVGAGTSAAVSDATPPASLAAPRPDAALVSAESELLKAVEPAPSASVPATERAGAFSTPVQVKAEAPPETPTPILRSANPVPTPVPSGRPLILQPPLRFGQRAPEPGVSAASPPPVPSSPDLPESKPALAQAPSVPEPNLPPPAPIASFGQDNIQALFMTDEVLDLQKISRLAAELPGVQACVIATRETAVTGGLLPEGFDVTALLGLAPRVGEAAGRLPIGALKHFTLYGERYSVSFFERSGLCLCAVHRARSFVPGVREKLVALADELAG